MYTKSIKFYTTLLYTDKKYSLKVFAQISGCYLPLSKSHWNHARNKEKGKRENVKCHNLININSHSNTFQYVDVIFHPKESYFMILICAPWSLKNLEKSFRLENLNLYNKSDERPRTLLIILYKNMTINNYFANLKRLYLGNQ